MTAATGLGVTGTSAGHPVAARWAWRLAPLWTGLGSLALYALFLGRQSVRWQEAQAIETASGSWGAWWDAARGDEAPHVGYDAVLKLWLDVAGTGEWAVRAPAAVAGAVTVGLTCALGMRLLGRVAALLAAGVVATSIVAVQSAQAAQGTALALAAVTAATLALVSALERPRWWRWTLWAVAASIAVVASLPAAAALAAHVAAFVVHRPRRATRGPAVALAVVAAVTVTVAAVILSSRAGDVGVALPDARDTGDDLWRLIGLTPIPLAIAVLGIVMLATGRLPGVPTWSTVLLATWLGAPVVAALLLSVVRPALDPADAATALPALALLVAAGVVSQQRWVAIGLAAALGAGAAFRLVEWYTSPSVEDWRAAVTAIEAQQRAGEAVLVLPTRQRAAAGYYAGDGFVVDRARGHRVWLLIGETDAVRRLELARATVRPPRYALLEERRFGDRLWLQLWVEP